MGEFPPVFCDDDAHKSGEKSFVRFGEIPSKIYKITKVSSRIVKSSTECMYKCAIFLVKKLDFEHIF